MTYMGKPSANQSVVWDGAKFVAASSNAPIFEWNGTDLSQFSNSTDLTVSSSVVDPTRNAIIWSPSDNTFDARLFNFELPDSYKIVTEVAKSNTGLHTHALVSGQDEDHWFGSGAYGANLRMIGSDNGASSHEGGTVSITTTTINGYMYTIIGITVQHAQNNLIQWVSKPSPEMWLSQAGANGTAFNDSGGIFGTLGAGWSSSGSFYPGIGYQTQTGAPSDWEWLSFKVYNL